MSFEYELREQSYIIFLRLQCNSAFYRKKTTESWTSKSEQYHEEQHPFVNQMKLLGILESTYKTNQRRLQVKKS